MEVPQMKIGNILYRERRYCKFNKTSETKWL